jgi:hypothetical protein
MWLTVPEISAEVGVFYGTVQAILTEDLTCNALLWNSFLASPAPKKRTLLHYHHQSPSRGRNVSELHERRHNKWWDMRLRIWFGNETIIFAVHVARISKTEQSASVCSKVSSSLHGMHCLLWICPRRSTVNHHHCVLSSEATEAHRYSKEAKETGISRMGCAKRQHTLPHISFCCFFLANHVTPVVDEKLYSLTWLPATSGCSPNLNSTKMKEIQWHSHHQGEYNEALDDYSEILILKMSPTMAETLASVCGFRRRLFWRGLTICCCKQLIFFTESVSELVDHTSNGISNIS